MEHQPQIEAEELEKPDNFASEYAAALRSLDYGDTRIFPDIEELKRLGNYWADELKNPARSERSKNEINKIVGRAAFEIYYREHPAKAETLTLEQVFDLEFESVELTASPEQQAA